MFVDFTLDSGLHSGKISSHVVFLVQNIVLRYKRQNHSFVIDINVFVHYGLASVLLSELADRFKLHTALSGFRMFNFTIN